MILWFSGACAVLALMSSAAYCADDAAQWNAAIERVAQKELSARGLPSIQLAIGHKGKVVFDEAYGLADIEHNVPATRDTMYRTASISKWLTGTAAMRLSERGQIDLDTPIQEYCPEFPAKQWPVTTRQLLAHTSGVRHYANHDAMLESATTEDSKKEMTLWVNKNVLSMYTRYTDSLGPLETFKDDPLMFEPGTQHMYSSFGFRVLGCVLRGAAGRPYRDVLRKEVIKPSGMTTIVEDDAFAIVPNRASGYSFVNRNELRRANFRDVSENLPAGGHLSTARDLVLFSQAFDQGKLVTQETIEFMSQMPKASNGAQISSGYGHGVDLIGGFEGSIGHPGSQAGTSTLLILLPERDLSIAVMTNVDGWRGAKDVIREVLKVIDKEGIPAGS